jgi:hypothetical protein
MSALLPEAIETENPIQIEKRAILYLINFLFMPLNDNIKPINGLTKYMKVM